MRGWNGTLTSLIAAGALAIAAVPGAAQAQTTPPSWLKVCNPDSASGQMGCLVIQQLVADTGQFIASVDIRWLESAPTQLLLVVQTPIRMALPPGVRAQIDTSAATQLEYQICMPDRCYAQLAVNMDFVNALKRGGTLNIATIDESGQTLQFPMTLTGFTRVFDGPGLSTEEAQAAQNAANATLQDRAEAARQRLIDAQAGLTPSP